MNKKIIDYEGFEAYAQGVREKYATKNNLPKRISDLTEDTTHKTVTDDEKKRWNDKVDKVSGKALSSNDYTSADKAKVDAIPPNPKYTDTIPDLTPYAKTENIPTKVSQLNNDKKYMSMLDNPFFTMKNIQYQIKDDWNTQPFYQGWQLVFSHKKPNSPSNGNKYLVYTSFDSTTKPNENTPHVKSSIRQLALNINTGKWFLREGYLDPNNNNKALSLSPNEQGELTELPYTINPKWYEWKEISSDYVTKEDIKKLINDIPTLKKEVVTSLPQTGKDDVIYLVKDEKGKDNNNYLEYLWLNDKYELIGSTQVDLTNYAKKDDVVASKIIDTYVLNKDFATALIDDQDFLKAIKRDVFTLVFFEESQRNELMEKAGFESILYYKGGVCGICLLPTDDYLEDTFVKQNKLFKSQTYITSNFMSNYNKVIQEQFVELQSSLKQYVKNCLNRKLNVADIREFTQQELEEAFR